MPISSANERLGDRFLWLTSILFIGLALAGKGFAYLLPDPLFITECMMLVGILVLLRAGAVRQLFSLPQTYILVALALWSAFRTIPYIPVYKMDAIRDAFLIAYLSWALIIAGLMIAKPERFNTAVRWFRKFTIIFLIGCPLIWVLSRFLGGSLPQWPWAPGVPILLPKAGDTCVILAGILGYWVAGFMTQINLYYMGSLLACLGITGAFNRGGLLSFLTALFLCIACKPRSPWPWRILFTMFFGASLLYVSAINIQIPGRDRFISFDQFSQNFMSMIGASNRNDLEATKRWRMDWWEKIIDETFHGPYKVMGRGYGISLGEAHGFGSKRKETMLRSPHNGHLNVLARSGVPGFGLWLGALGAWGVGMAYCFFRSRYRRDGQWPNIFLWLSAFFIAANANASFDVYLEGPMGGIVLWSIYGMGMAAMWIYKNNPEVLRHPEMPVPVQASRSGFNRFGPMRGYPVPAPLSPVPEPQETGQPAQLAGLEPPQNRN